MANLSDILKPGELLPADDLMISKALEILGHSAHGQQLVNFASIENISIRIMATPQPATYLPETKLVYIGVNKGNPVSPARFVLMLAGVLREAQQETAGIKHPHLHAPVEEHIKVSLAKQEDRLWYMCTIACQLNDQSAFTEYNFLDELRKMGHHEALELYLRQEGRTEG